MKVDIQDKINYNECLEDIILELNGKIDGLRKENLQITN